MKDRDYDSFVDLMKELSLNFKGEIIDRKINLYFDRLKKYKFSAVKRGINYLISTNIYNEFPPVGKITEAIENSRLEINI